MSHCLIAEGLRKVYRRRTVVNGVDLTVHSGEVVGLLGPNGAGKTTTFYMVVGLVLPDGGRVLLNDKDIADLPMYQRARAGISYLPQEASIFRRMTVRDNLWAIFETLPGTVSEKQGRMQQLLEDFRIEHIADAFGYALSGGERRRVEIARALVLDPSFVLLDEPFAGIDPIAVADIQGLIVQLKERNIGILISDHNVRETLGVCDRAYIMNEGVILEKGTPHEIAESPRARQIYLGDKFRL